jgi:hypothetical protein
VNHTDPCDGKNSILRFQRCIGELPFTDYMKSAVFVFPRERVEGERERERN